MTTAIVMYNIQDGNFSKLVNYRPKCAGKLIKSIPLLTQQLGQFSTCSLWHIVTHRQRPLFGSVNDLIWKSYLYTACFKKSVELEYHVIFITQPVSSALIPVRGKPGTPSFGYLSWQDKKVNQLSAASDNDTR